MPIKLKWLWLINWVTGSSLLQIIKYAHFVNFIVFKEISDHQLLQMQNMELKTKKQTNGMEWQKPTTAEWKDNTPLQSFTLLGSHWALQPPTSSLPSTCSSPNIACTSKVKNAGKRKEQSSSGSWSCNSLTHIYDSTTKFILFPFLSFKAKTNNYSHTRHPPKMPLTVIPDEL